MRTLKRRVYQVLILIFVSLLFCIIIWFNINSDDVSHQNINNNLYKQKTYQEMKTFRSIYIKKYINNFISNDLGVGSLSSCVLPPNTFITLKKGFKVPKIGCGFIPTFVYYDKDKQTLNIDKNVCPGGFRINWVLMLRYYENYPKGFHVPIKKWEWYNDTVTTVKMKDENAEVVCEAFKRKYFHDGPNLRIKFVPASKDIIEKNKKKINKEYYKNSTLNHAPSILTIKLEAVSRSEMFRSFAFPETMKLIKKHFTCWDQSEDNDCTHRNFIFNRYNARSHNTADNLVPMFCGQAYPRSAQQQRSKTFSLGFRQKRWAWEYGNFKFGYTTMWGHDWGAGLGGIHYDDAAMGVDMRYPAPPIYLDKWYETRRKVYNGKMAASCVGDLSIPQMAFDYTLDLWRHPGLKNIPLFATISATDHHTPSPIYTPLGYEKHLSEFLKKFMKENKDTVIMLFGDHGHGPYRNVVYSKKWAKRGEQYSAAFILFVPTGMLNERPDIEKRLLINSQRLVHGYDFYVTMKSMMNWPNVKNVQNTKMGINLLANEVPPDRSCKDIGLDNSKCVCNLQKTKWFNKDFEKSHEEMASTMIIEINKRGHNKYPKICRKVELNQIDTVIVHGSFVVQISSKIGPSKWEGVFDKNEMITLIQVTQYQKYDICIKDGVELQFCICKQFPDGTL